MSVFTTGSLEVRDSSNNLVFAVGDRHPSLILGGSGGDRVGLGSTTITGSFQVIPFAGSTINIITGSMSSTGVKLGIGTVGNQDGVGVSIFGDLGLSDTATTRHITMQVPSAGGLSIGTDGNNYGRLEYTSTSNSVQLYTRAGASNKAELMLTNNQVSIGKGSAASSGIDLEVAGTNKTVLIGDNADPPSGPAALFLGNEDTKIYHDDFMGGQLVLQSTSSIALVGDRTIGASEDAFAYLIARNEASVGIAGREDVNIQAPGGLQIDNNLCLTGALDMNGTLHSFDPGVSADQTRATFAHADGARIDLMRRESNIFGNELLGSINFIGSEDGGVTRAGGAAIEGIATDGYSTPDASGKLQFYTSNTGGTLNLAMTITEDRDVQVGQKLKVGGNIVHNGDDNTVMQFDAGATPKCSFSGKIKVTGNAIQNSAGNDTITFDASQNSTFDGNVSIGDDKKLYFGADNDVTIEYDEDSTDKLLYTGATLRIDDDVKMEFGITTPPASFHYDQANTDRFIITSPPYGTVVDGDFGISGSNSIEPDPAGSASGRSDNGYWLKIAEIASWGSNAASTANATFLVHLNRGRVSGTLDAKSAIVFIEHEKDAGAAPRFTVEFLNLAMTEGTAADNYSDWSKDDFKMTYNSTGNYEAQIWIRAPHQNDPDSNNYRAFVSMLGASRTTNDPRGGGWRICSNSAWQSSIPSLADTATALYPNKRFNHVNIGSGGSMPSGGENAEPILTLTNRYAIPGNAGVNEDLAYINFDTTTRTGGGDPSTFAQIRVESASEEPEGGSIPAQIAFSTRQDSTSDALIDGMVITQPFSSFGGKPRVNMPGGFKVGGTAANTAMASIAGHNTMGLTHVMLDVQSDYSTSATDYNIQKPVAYFTGDTSKTAAQGVVCIESTDTSDESGDVTLRLQQNDTTPSSDAYHFAGYRSTTKIGGYSYTGVLTPFTGRHYTKLDGTDSYRLGTIMKSTGEIIYDDTVDNAWVKSTGTTTAKESGVVGVYSGPASGAGGFDDAHGYNAVGEGKVLVTDEGGDISIGDYICSSNVAGHGMKQDDDLLHNYTVAKALTAINWDDIDVDPELGFKSTLLACTYHCG